MSTTARDPCDAMSPFVDEMLSRPRPERLRAIALPAAPNTSPRRSTGETRSSISSSSTGSATARSERGRCSTAATFAAARAAGWLALGPLGRVGGDRWQGGTSARRHVEARLPAGPRRHRALARPGLQAARPPGHLPRLRHPGLPRRRSALRQPRRSRRAGRRGARARNARASSTSSSTTRAPTGSTPPDTPGGPP